MDELLANFLTEIDEKLAEAIRATLLLKRAPGDPAALSLVFRIVHTIKGTCGFLGLPRLEQVLHSAESLLAQARDGATPVTPELVTGVRRALDHAERIVAGLKAGPGPFRLASGPQDGAQASWVQPIGRAWAALPWVAQSLAGQLDKQVDLVARGHDAELGRDLVEPIRDMLTHMVRNSVDHGIETPAERTAAGKPERGRITLHACRADGGILIELSDDGRGLATDRIRARALQRGLVTEAELAAMQDAEVQRFIFHAGLSTASVVTVVSGRGMGLDVVRTDIERVGGTIGLSSQPGHGTTITLWVPACAREAGRPSLLVVEDSVLFRQLLLSALAASGFEVTVAGSASEALTLLDAGTPYDAIVSDIEMPDMDGLAFARRVRARSAWAELPMVALSGRSGAADMEAALAAGFTAHVTKFDRNELVMALRRCLVSTGQCRPPRAAIGQTHSTRPLRTPTYQS